MHPLFLRFVVVSGIILSSYVVSSLVLNWMIIGDTNEILCSAEVSWGIFNMSRANLMGSVMHTCGFVDMNTVGGFSLGVKTSNMVGMCEKKKK